MQNLLTMKNISKNFGKVQALKNANFELNKGEIHALIGENGAGKSTLMNILSGSLQPDKGCMTFEGKEFRPLSVKNSKEIGIEFVHQEITLIKDLTVAQNIFFANEPSKSGFINDKKIKEYTTELFKILQINTSLDEKVKNLTVAQQQTISIAKGLIREIKILILDEPTTSMGTEDAKKLFELMRYIKSQGVSIIFISHRLEEILEISDRITVMRDGEYIKTIETKKCNQDMLVSLLVGREITSKIKSASEVDSDAPIVFEAKGITSNYVENCSFSLRKGEILGISGLMGAGRTELMRAIFGIDKLIKGETFVNGKKVKINSPNVAKKYGLCYLPEDRNKSGLMLEKSVGFNSTIANIENNSKFGMINQKKIDEEAILYNSQVKTKYFNLDDKIKHLSGGNRQKVIIARWLATNQNIIVFDEPTKGIDIGAKAEIYEIIKHLAKEGKSIIVISSEILELQKICDRILVMSEGKITGNLDISIATQEKIMEYATNKGGQNNGKETN